ncbi:MAG: ATP-binding protein, partial [Sphingomonadales bacterium]|nr:ATP-binding protein [Sphingomonadales bacterium]
TADSGLPVDEGLAIPLRGRSGRGELILGGIPQLCFEDLIPAEAIADEIGRAMDDDAAQAIARELAMSRLRSQLAADLHDGVAQTLAGVQFRLQALKARTVDQTATPEDIDRISEGIAAEQNHIRTMIERLRRGTIEPGERDLRQELLPLVETLAMQWGVAIALDEAGERVPLAVAQVYEVQQVVREAVANAVRHGRATQIELTLAARSPRGFMLGIRDNGAGCAAQAQPRSIAARVSTLRGTLVFSSQAGNTRLSIVVPETTA